MKIKMTLLITTGVLLILSLILGFSYALWMITNTQTGENLVDSECFNIGFTEDTSSDINLVNAFPMRDSVGMSTDPYSFSIENTCDTYAYYTVVVEVLSNTTLSHDLVKVALDNYVPDVVTLLDSATAVNSGASAYEIYSDGLASGDSVTHDFRLWIDEAGTVDNASNKIIDAKIVINAVPSNVIYEEPILAGADPVLTDGMIPVTIGSDGTVYKASIYEEWYDYETSMWANAVLVNDPSINDLSAGSEIPMSNISHMYVWIPRYDLDYDTIVNASTAVDITFVDVNTPAHNAFTFGDDDLEGLWFGKFELSENGEVKPNVNSVHAVELDTTFWGVRSLNDGLGLNHTSDIHIMKNIDWGAVAYLTQSKYGICEADGTCSLTVLNNAYHSLEGGGDMITGCGGHATDSFNVYPLTGLDICPVDYRWTTANGVLASTTHNITGIYDMAAGRYEYTMANITNEDGSFNEGAFEFSPVPDEIYYDHYEYRVLDAPATNGIPGDATDELMTTNWNMPHWNLDGSTFPYDERPFIVRGGGLYGYHSSGIFAYNGHSGLIVWDYSTRTVITPLI